MRLDKAAIAALIPHAGSMCLLDEVASWDSTRVSAVSRTHRDKNNPLIADGRLSALSAIEYAAQAMAVHGALVGAVSARPSAGYLVSVRNVVCHAPRVDHLAGDLLIEAEQKMADGKHVMYAFSLSIGAAPVLTGTATVVLDLGEASR